jgi:hypothetical protein
MKRTILAVLALACAATASPAKAPTVSDGDVVVAYEYMLARWLVLRQEARDFNAGFKWNTLAQPAPRSVDAANNPDFDVILSEAWIAVDDASCTLLTLPQIEDRYYTVEIVNGWGEVIDNINQRTYPNHPSGGFALCLDKAKVELPAGAQRVEVAANTSRILIRIELGADPAAALALQKQITMTVTGSPKIADAVVKPDFADDKLPGVEAFDKTEEILASEADVNKNLADIEYKTRAVAAAAADPDQRAHIDEVIHKQAIPAFLAAIPKMGRMVDGWFAPRVLGNYGNDYLMRSVIDYTDIWANTVRELGYFNGVGIDGSQTYSQTFPKDILPAARARYSWSVTAVDAKDRSVIANPLDRHQLNKLSDLKFNADGSLTLVFAPKLPDGAPQSNWLPTPAGRDYNLTYRFYVPAKYVVLGRYYPPLLSIRP